MADISWTTPVAAIVGAGLAATPGILAWLRSRNQDSVESRYKEKDYALTGMTTLTGELRKDVDRLRQDILDLRDEIANTETRNIASLGAAEVECRRRLACAREEVQAALEALRKEQQPSAEREVSDGGGSG